MSTCVTDVCMCVCVCVCVFNCRQSPIPFESWKAIDDKHIKSMK